jgi:hypothetical protein
VTEKENVEDYRLNCPPIPLDTCLIPVTGQSTFSRAEKAQL